MSNRSEIKPVLLLSFEFAFSRYDFQLEFSIFHL